MFSLYFFVVSRVRSDQSPQLDSINSAIALEELESESNGNQCRVSIHYHALFRRLTVNINMFCVLGVDYNKILPKWCVGRLVFLANKAREVCHDRHDRFVLAAKNEINVLVRRAMHGGRST